MQNAGIDISFSSSQLPLNVSPSILSQWKFDECMYLLCIEHDFQDFCVIPWDWLSCSLYCCQQSIEQFRLAKPIVHRETVSCVGNTVTSSVFARRGDNSSCEEIAPRCSQRDGGDIFRGIHGAEGPVWYEWEVFSPPRKRF